MHYIVMVWLYISNNYFLHVCLALIKNPLATFLEAEFCVMCKKTACYFFRGRVLRNVHLLYMIVIRHSRQDDLRRI